MNPTVDIGQAVSFVTNDPAWWKKCLTVGAYLLIPIAGVFVMMGWERRVFEAAGRGEKELPTPTFADAGYGVPLFVASLNLALPILVIIFVVAGLAVAMGFGAQAAGDNERIQGIVSGVVGLMMLGMYGLIMAAALAMSLLGPEVRRRGCRGEMGPLFSPRESIQAIRGNIGGYFMTLVGHFVVGMVGGIGAFACYVGMLLTLPMAVAMRASLTAQWDRAVAGQTPPAA